MNDARRDRSPSSRPGSPDAVAPDGHSLRKNVVYAVVGNGVLNACRLAVVALLAKFASAEIQGAFTYANQALAAPIVLFCGLELRAAFVADAGGEFTFGAYRALRSLGMATAAVVLVIVSVWMAFSDQTHTYVWLLVLCVCLGRVAFGQAEIYWGVYQRRERLDLLAWSNALRGVALLAPFAIVFLAWRAAPSGSPGEVSREHLVAAAVWAGAAYALLWTLIWWFFDRRLVVGKPDVEFSWRWSELRRLAWQTLPLGLVFLLINLCETVTQWFIKRAAAGEGWADVGYFGAMRAITLGATFLIVQVNTAAGNRLATFYQTDLRAFTRLALKTTGVALCIGGCFLVATWLFGEWLLRVVYTPTYSAHYSDFVLLAVAQTITLLAAVFGAITTLMRRFWIQVPVHLAVLCATAIAASMLIGPADPVGGGARTALIRSSVQAVLYLGCVLLGMRWRRRAGQH